ncbi:hypothetical protein [Paremcibacter congregatus]|uniref:PepSY domain-containing protein n=1 Tax=Paremcibacter congregatus TaxID=2043170 RepID=A0A2G4YYY4_9PROT|nr:hypothetical protein [Paremcibacter congregatus]PHZ86666.1 hypothetical protein CRD36_01970 [Paremcibacter congregatus]QDE26467.1 hypothetical protein FIV45_03845 [Paremcibacter congregatus]
MTKATTYKAITATAIIALATTFGSAAFAHDISTEHTTMSSAEIERNVSKQNAKKLVETLLKRKYSGEGLEARTIEKDGDTWKVSIKRGTRKVATAIVDENSGNIHVTN